MRWSATRWLVLLGSIGALITTLTGCRTVGMNAIPARSLVSYTYNQGRASQGFAANSEDVRKAVAESAADLRIHSMRVTEMPGVVTYEGKTAGNNPVTITLHSQSVFTLVTVRIGLLGDEALSRAFMDRIGIRLGTAPANALPSIEPPATENGGVLSRDAVKDEVMLRDRIDAGYRDQGSP